MSEQNTFKTASNTVTLWDNPLAFDAEGQTYNVELTDIINKGPAVDLQFFVRDAALPNGALSDQVVFHLAENSTTATHLFKCKAIAGMPVPPSYDGWLCLLDGAGVCEDSTKTVPEGGPPCCANRGP